MISNQYDFHTGTTFIPVRLSYRYEILHVNTPKTEIDLNESEINLNESEISLNECIEHFLKLRSIQVGSNLV